MILNDEQQKVIAELYTELYDRLFAYGINVLRNRQQTEEAIQDAFRIACAKADSLMASENRQGWIMNTFKYVLHTMIRSNAKLHQLVIAASSVEEVAAASPEDVTELQAVCSEVLKPEDLKLLELVALKKYSILEASRELGISAGACYKRFQRAKSKLRKNLEDREK